MKCLIIADIKSNNYNGTCTGHYFAVARNYLEIFRNKIHTLVAGGPIYKRAFASEYESLPFDTIQPDKTPWISKWHYLLNAKTLFRKAKGATLVLQQNGVASSFLAIFLFYRQDCRLFLIQYNSEGISSFGKRLLYRLARKKIDGIICPNEQVGQDFGIPYCVVPDYIYNNNQKQQGIPYSEKRYDVCFVGRIEDEKGVIEVARKIAGTKFKMIIAGRVHNKEQEKELIAIKNTCNNITLQLEYISDNVYQQIISNSRFCILNYQGEYSRRSSGVVLDIIFANVPIIGKQCLALDFIAQYQIGSLYQDLNSLDLDAEITKNRYEQYITNIALYKEEHRKHKEKLIDFIGLS